MKKILITLAGGVLIFGSISLIRMNSLTTEERAEERGRPRVAVRTQSPQFQTLVVRRSFTGDISGVDQADIYSEAPGRLRRYAFEEGDDVQKNDLIALIDREVTGMEFELLRVRSPIDGVVTRLYRGIGETVNTQQPVLSVTNLDRMKVSFNIPEKDLALVDRGNPVKLSVTARPGIIFEGNVVRISHSIDRISRTAYAEAHFTNPDRALLPGMFADIEVLVREIEDALLIPRDAAIRAPDGDGQYVFVLEDGRAIRRDILTGYSEDGLIQVTEGLSADEKIIVEGQFFIEDGERIRVVE